MILNITKVYRSDKDKAGNLLKTKDGRPYTRIAIWTKEYGEQALSGFGSLWNQEWKENTKIEVGKDIEIKEIEKDGKKYFNFARVDRLAVLENRIAKIEEYINNQAQNRPTMGIDEPDLDDMPF